MPRKKKDELGDLDMGSLDDIDISEAGLDPILDEKSPFSYKSSGKIQTDYPKEKSAILEAFKRRGEVEAKRRRLATDSEYWACVVFQSREQKEAFLAAMNWAKYGDKYLDGKRIAKDAGINLPADEPSYQGEKSNGRLVRDVGLIGGE